jgi:hypothetical protein
LRRAIQKEDAPGFVLLIAAAFDAVAEVLRTHSRR